MERTQLNLSAQRRTSPTPHRRWDLPLFLYYAYIVSSPLIVYGVESSYMNVRFSRILLALVAISVVALTPHRLLRLFSGRGVYEIILFCVLFYGLMGGAWADPLRWPKRFFGWVECCLIYYTVVVFVGSMDELVRSVKVYCCSSVIVVAVCGYQVSNLLRGNLDATAVPFPRLAMLEFYDRLNNSGEFGVLGNMSRITGTFGEPNMLAGYAASTLFLLWVATISTSRKVFRYCVLSTAAALLCALVLTFSKSGYLSLLCGATVMCVSLREIRARVLAASVFAVSIAAALLYKFNELAIERFAAGDSGHVEYSKMIVDRFFSQGPWDILLGAGFGGLAEGSSHTFLITIMYELGIVGVILWFCTMFIPGRVWFISHIQRSGYVKFVCAAVAASGVAVCVGLNLYDYLMYPFVWVVFGFCVIAARAGKA